MSIDKNSSGTFHGDLTRNDDRRYNWHALLAMMLRWGRDAGAQDRYRSIKQPRWRTE